MRLRATVLACVLAWLWTALLPAGAPATGRAPAKVIIVSMAGVTWEDVAAGRAPALRALGERWSMGALSIRTVDSPTDPASAFATIGAGNRARARDNDRLHFGAVPGALGEALHRHGLHTGVVDPTSDPARRPGVLALADTTGHVDLEGGPDEQARIVSSADVALVELAQTSRTGDVAADDRMLGRLAADVDLTRTTLLVLGTSGRSTTSAEHLMVAVAAGAGVRLGGWLTSATTHRDGLVALQDVAPGILRLLGIAPPASMTGQPLRSVPSTGNRLARLLRLQAAALAYSHRLAVFITALGVLGVGVFLLGWRRLRTPEARPDARPDARPTTMLRVAALAVTAAPAACLVLAAIGGDRWSAGRAFAVLAAITAGIVAAALAGPWRRSPLGPPIIAGAFSAAAIAADVVSGSHGQLTSLIGYSPIVAGRFYGLSALSFAVLATLVLVLAGMLAGALPKHRLAVAAGIGAVTVAVAGAPVFGAKFGSILTLVPAFGLLAVLLAGGRLSLARLGLLGGAAAFVALGIGALDALRPAQSRTHLGRFVAALLGGHGPVADVLARKAASNLGIFVRTPVAILIPAALVLVAVVVLRPPGWLAGPLGRVPGLRPGLLSAIAANAVGMLVNDSGPAIPAMGLAVGVPFALAILLAASAGQGPSYPARLAPGDAADDEVGEGRGEGSAAVAPEPVP